MCSLAKTEFHGSEGVYAADERTVCVADSSPHELSRERMCEKKNFVLGADMLTGVSNHRVVNWQSNPVLTSVLLYYLCWIEVEFLS